MCYDQISMINVCLNESNINREWFAWEYEGNSILRFRARQQHKQKTISQAAGVQMG